MKIYAQNNKKAKIILSKQEWEQIGLEANWLKTAGTAPVRLPYAELCRRMIAIGWTIKNKGPHDMFLDPSGKCSPVTIGKHNYETSPNSWKSVIGQLLRSNKNLRFVFISPFIIPKNFNVQTQTIEENKPNTNSKIIKCPFMNVPNDNWLVEHDGQWKKIIDIDYSDKSIMFEDGTMFEARFPTQMLNIKKESPQLAMAYRKFKIVRIAKLSY